MFVLAAISLLIQCRKMLSLRLQFTTGMFAVLILIGYNSVKQLASVKLFSKLEKQWMICDIVPFICNTFITILYQVVLRVLKMVLILRTNFISCGEDFNHVCVIFFLKTSCIRSLEKEGKVFCTTVPCVSLTQWLK